MLKGKTIVLGVTGSIAAYKMANVASMLVKRGCEAHVVMTKFVFFQRISFVRSQMESQMICYQQP